MESRNMAAQETFPNLSASLGSGEKNERCLLTQMDLENRCYPNISWHLRWTIQNVWDHFLRQLYQLHVLIWRKQFPCSFSMIHHGFKSDLGFVPLDISNFKVEHSKFPSFLVKITADILVKPCPFWCCLVEQFFSLQNSLKLGILWQKLLPWHPTGRPRPGTLMVLRTSSRPTTKRAMRSTSVARTVAEKPIKWGVHKGYHSDLMQNPQFFYEARIRNRNNEDYEDLL